jgi:hypothetical protein
MQVEDSASEPVPFLVEDFLEEFEVVHRSLADHITIIGKYVV